MKINIVINLQVEGRHRWENCPIKEMSFLKDYHRHIFHIRCERGVNHTDRDVEIIQFKREVEDYFRRHYFDKELGMCDFGNRSCEDIGVDLQQTYDLYAVEVLEDGENGAKIYKYY